MLPALKLELIPFARFSSAFCTFLRSRNLRLELSIRCYEVTEGYGRRRGRHAALNQRPRTYLGRTIQQSDRSRVASSIRLSAKSDAIFVADADGDRAQLPSSSVGRRDAGSGRSRQVDHLQSDDVAEP